MGRSLARVIDEMLFPESQAKARERRLAEDLEAIRHQERVSQQATQAMAQLHSSAVRAVRDGYVDAMSYTDGETLDRVGTTIASVGRSVHDEAAYQLRAVSDTRKRHEHDFFDELRVAWTWLKEH